MVNLEMCQARCLEALKRPFLEQQACDVIGEYAQSISQRSGSEHRENPDVSSCLPRAGGRSTRMFCVNGEPQPSHAGSNKNPG
jgi:hypothetical protein